MILILFVKTNNSKNKSTYEMLKQYKLSNNRVFLFVTLKCHITAVNVCAASEVKCAEDVSFVFL